MAAPLVSLPPCGGDLSATASAVLAAALGSVFQQPVQLEAERHDGAYELVVYYRRHGPRRWSPALAGEAADAARAAIVCAGMADMPVRMYGCCGRFPILALCGSRAATDGR